MTRLEVGQVRREPKTHERHTVMGIVEGWAVTRAPNFARPFVFLQCDVEQWPVVPPPPPFEPYVTFASVNDRGGLGTCDARPEVAATYCSDIYPHVARITVEYIETPERKP